MKTVTAHIESVSPYSASKFYQTPKLNRELAKDYEERTWKDRAHYTDDGHVYIPPMDFKLALESTAQFLGMQIPGKGKSTYTKHFRSGILVMEGLVLKETKDTIQGIWLHVPSDGKKGGSKRVLKCFPIIPEWGGAVTYHLLDDIIANDVFEEHLHKCGNFNGIGRWRPQNGGLNGRFVVKKFIWN